VSFWLFQASTQERNSIYAIWLRLMTFITAAVVVFILFAPTFFLSHYDADLPWNEETRILPPGKTPTRVPSIDQPKLTDILSYRTQVQLDDCYRGNISFIIYPEGIVKGIWAGKYDRYGDTHCTILAASFAGNIDPSRACIEGSRHDASKLYFVTRGSFTMLEEPSLGRSRGINGFLYVRGWLDPNYTAVGELFITEDKKSFEVYYLSAKPIDR
jgi:hypothetical protein